MSAKNVLLATRPLTPPWDEASKNFAYFLAREIQDPELRLHILTAKGAFLDELIHRNIVQHPVYPPDPSGRAGFPLGQKVRLPLYLSVNAQEYDVVHYLFTPTKLNTFLLRNFVYHAPKTIQTIATLREDILSPEDWKRLFYADRLVVYSDYSKAKLEAAGFTGVERIYPGIDLGLFRPASKDPEALRALDLTPDDLVVMFPGEYARLGATDMLADMLYRHLPDTPNNLKFVFACRVKDAADEKKKREVQKKLHLAGVGHRVRFTDSWKLPMPAMYGLADVVVFPVGNMRGKFDIPLVILEAYACGRPVILSDLEIFREFSNPTISVTVPKDDETFLWAAIERLLREEAERKTLGASARAFMEQSFDLKETARKYEELYRSL